MSNPDHNRSNPLRGFEPVGPTFREGASDFVRTFFWGRNLLALTGCSLLVALWANWLTGGPRQLATGATVVAYLSYFRGGLMPAMRRRRFVKEG